MTKKKEKKEEHILLRGLKKLGKALVENHRQYVLDGLIIDAQSDDLSTRLRAISQLKKDFPDIYEEIKSELKKK